MSGKIPVAATAALALGASAMLWALLATTALGQTVEGAASSEVNVLNVVGAGGGGGTQRTRITSVPDVTVIGNNSTSPCVIAVGGGGSGVGFGFGLTVGLTDASCEARQDATWLVQVGREEAAIRRVCMEPKMREALAEECETETENLVSARTFPEGYTRFAFEQDERPFGARQ